MTGPCVPLTGWSEIEIARRMSLKRVLIIGGSTRAAAWSARRAGWQPICADLFADLDTRQIAEVVPVRNYPESVPEDVAGVRADGWFYTGGLENRPDLIERLERSGASYGPLIGTSAAALRACRDPFWLADLLRQAQALPLEILPMDAIPPRDGSWMRKPLASAGGRAVTVWDEAAAISTDSEPCYFQARILGATRSAIYRSGGDEATFLGLTLQLNGVKSSNSPSPFHYCGSIGPLNPSETKGYRVELDRIANHLVTQCDLRGVFGIDFIVDTDGHPRVLEVNPRYTASVEIVELAQQRSLLSGKTTASERGREDSSWIGKVILYATEPIIAPPLTEYRSTQSEWEIPAVADVPVPGTAIDRGWPICSVLAVGDTSQACLHSLARSSDRVWLQLAHCGKP